MSDEPTIEQIRAARQRQLDARVEAEAVAQDFYNLLAKARLYGLNLSEIGRDLDVSNQAIHQWLAKAEAMRPE